MTNTTHPDRAVTTAAVDGRVIVEKHYTNLDPTDIHQAMLRLWLSALGSSPAGMPEPTGVHQSVLTMSHIQGEVVAVRGSLGSSIRQLDNLVALAIRLHDSGVFVARRRRGKDIVRSLQRKSTTIGAELRPAFEIALAHLAEMQPTGEELVISHGDFSPRNVIVESDGTLVLIDFDRLQMAGRGRDLAYLGAWIWVTCRLDNRLGVADWSAADAALAQYCRTRPAAADELRCTASFHRGAAVLRIAASWSALAGRPKDARQLIDEVATLKAPIGQGSAFAPSKVSS